MPPAPPVLILNRYSRVFGLTDELIDKSLIQFRVSLHCRQFGFRLPKRVRRNAQGSDIHLRCAPDNGDEYAAQRGVYGGEDEGVRGF